MFDGGVVGAWIVVKGVSVKIVVDVGIRLFVEFRREMGWGDAERALCLPTLRLPIGPRECRQGFRER